MGRRCFTISWMFHGKLYWKCGEGYFLEIDIQYLEKLLELHNDLPFLAERMKIEKLVTKLYDKTEYVIHIRNLKQTLNQGLILKKAHRVTKFN